MDKTKIKAEQIDYCFSGEEALEKLKESTQSYKVIFIDFNMAGLSGPETTRLIRDMFHGREQPTIIGLTAHSAKEELDKGKEAGMNKTLTKPLGYDDLIEALR